MKAFNQTVGEALTSRSAELVADVVAREFVRHPELERRFGKSVPEKMIQDTGFHLAYLAQAVAADSTGLFIDYIGWAKVLLVNLGIPAFYLVTLLESMKESLEAGLPADFSGLACGYLDLTLEQLPQMPDEVPSFMTDGTPLAVQYLGALLRGERHTANKLIMDAVDQGTSVKDIYLQVFERTQREIGRLWQVNEISVAQEHYCTAATQQIMSRFYPHIFRVNKTGRTLVAASASGDLHEVGVRMVCDLFELAGWNTHYLGANVPMASVLQTLVESKADVLALSATITYHVRAVESLIVAVRAHPGCRGVTILVGGYPFNVDPGLWRSIGADGSANGAQDAVDLANRLTGGSFAVPKTSLPAAAAPVEPASLASGHGIPSLDDRLYAELSQTNNELVNYQREMARKEVELAAAQTKLLASEQRYLNLSACSPIGILEMDREGHCLYSNPRWHAYTGMEASESLGDGWQRALDGRDKEILLREWTAVREDNTAFNRQIRFVRTDGTERWAQFASRCICASSGEPTGYVCTVEDITAAKQSEGALAQAHEELIDVSHRAGMAEIATGVLHNVGNVLNSVNVSANMLLDHVRTTPVVELNQVIALLREQGASLGEFFANDQRGPKVMDFLSKLAGMFTELQAAQVEEVAALQKNIDHIKDIVSMQQSYACVAGLTETLKVTDLVEDTLRMNVNTFQHHGVRLEREFEAEVPAVTTEKHKVLQILVNLVSNARAACDESSRKDKQVTVRVTNSDGRVRIQVIDNGVGIPAENLNRIFNHGFTTKKGGHGFGLHNSANAAKEIGATLAVQSGGPGRGATFTLELPERSSSLSQ